LFREIEGANYGGFCGLESLVIGWVGFAGLGDNDTDFAVLHVSLEL
jgi:hypothetical protein